MLVMKRAPYLEAVRLLMARHVLLAELAEVVQASRRMVERSQRTIFAAYPHLYPIGGGSDAALIATVLGTAPLCTECVAKRTGVPGPRVDGVFGEIRTAVSLVIASARCQDCLEDKPRTYRLATMDGTATDGAVRIPPPAAWTASGGFSSNSGAGCSAPPAWQRRSAPPDGSTDSCSLPRGAVPYDVTRRARCVARTGSSAA